MSAIGAIRGSSLGTAKFLPKGESLSVKHHPILLTFIAQGHSTVHVRLTGLPRTATPADITRLLAKNKVHNITKGERAMCHQLPSSDSYNSAQLHSSITDSSLQDALTLPYPSRPRSQRLWLPSNN